MSRACQIAFTVSGLNGLPFLKVLHRLFPRLPFDGGSRPVRLVLFTPKIDHLSLVFLSSLFFSSLSFFFPDVRVQTL